MINKKAFVMQRAQPGLGQVKYTHPKLTLNVV